MQAIDWPFRAAEALEARALTFRELRRFHAAVYPGVWAPRDLELAPVQRARAAWLWSGRSGVLAGLSASAMHGAKWIDARDPAELIHTNRRPPRLLTVHSDSLLDGETQLIDGMATTTPARTAFDLGRRLPFVEGVKRIDALMNATHVEAADVLSVAERHRGVRGLIRLRRALDHVDGGAESPYESLRRLVLTVNGFPDLETQIEVVDQRGGVVARLDMGWREYRVAVEYDGAQHWTDSRQRTWDIDRLAMLESLGWIVIRVSAGLLHNRPEVVVERARAALTSRGCAMPRGRASSAERAV
jgi:very-short-patch-repair endonuclease